MDQSFNCYWKLANFSISAWRTLSYLLLSWTGKCITDSNFREILNIIISFVTYCDIVLRGDTDSLREFLFSLECFGFKSDI